MDLMKPPIAIVALLLACSPGEPELRHIVATDVSQGAETGFARVQTMLTPFNVRGRGSHYRCLFDSLLHDRKGWRAFLARTGRHECEQACQGKDQFSGKCHDSGSSCHLFE